MNKICILLSTYNGEKYLNEQLESLINQEGVDVNILVRDDGSTDATHDILNKWQEKGLLQWYTGENKGFAFSFMDLVKHAGRYDYYAFCDQDDIWLPNKLLVAVNKLSEIDDDNKLYCSNLYYYKDGENLGLIRKNILKYNIKTSLIRNIAVGCTIVFNSNLKELVSKQNPEFIIAHDYWLYQTAMLFGKVYYDENAYIYYRQHENNQLGAQINLLDICKRRINNTFNNKIGYCSSQAKELLKCYSTQMSPQTIEIIKTVAECKTKLNCRLKLLLSNQYTCGSFFNDFVLKIKILLGRL